MEDRYASFDEVAEDLVRVHESLSDPIPLPDPSHSVAVEFFEPGVRLLQETYSLISLGNYEAAVKDYRKILSMDLNYIRGYYVLGKYFYERGKIARSVRILKKGISVSHQTGILRSYLGYVYLQR